MPGLLAFLLVDDLGLEAVALGPAEVHPEEHLGPVGRLGAAGAGADREDRAALVVLAGEEEGGPLAAEVAPRARRPRGRARRSARGRRTPRRARGSSRRSSARRLEAAPQLDLGAQAVGLAEDLLGGPLVVPEAGLAGQRLELGDAAFLGLEVKDAPRSTGSARPGREPWTRPLVAGLEVLEQDRTELDQPQGRLAPGDDGVHAGAVAVVGADAAVAVTVEGGGVAADRQSRSQAMRSTNDASSACFNSSLSLCWGRIGGAARGAGSADPDRSRARGSLPGV